MSYDMIRRELAKLEELAAVAQEGPWSLGYTDANGADVLSKFGHVVAERMPQVGDAAFIAAMNPKTTRHVVRLFRTLLDWVDALPDEVFIVHGEPFAAKPKGEMAAKPLLIKGD